MNSKLISQEEKLLNKVMELVKKFPYDSPEVTRAVDDWAEVQEAKTIKELLKDIYIKPEIGKTYTLDELTKMGLKHACFYAIWEIFMNGGKARYCFFRDGKNYKLDRVLDVI